QSGHGDHSARSARAGLVLAATRPGTTATALATRRAPATTTTTCHAGTTGSRTTPARSAKSDHAHRPSPAPRGTPTRTARPANVVACHSTTATTCRWTKPSVLSTATSRALRRTELTSVT